MCIDLSWFWSGRDFCNFYRRSPLKRDHQSAGYPSCQASWRKRRRGQNLWDCFVQEWFSSGFRYSKKVLFGSTRLSRIHWGWILVIWTNGWQNWSSRGSAGWQQNIICPFHQELGLWALRGLRCSGCSQQDSSNALRLWGGSRHWCCILFGKKWWYLGISGRLPRNMRSGPCRGPLEDLFSLPAGLLLRSSSQFLHREASGGGSRRSKILRARSWFGGSWWTRRGCLGGLQLCSRFGRFRHAMRRGSFSGCPSPGAVGSSTSSGRRRIAAVLPVWEPLHLSWCAQVGPLMNYYLRGICSTLKTSRKATYFSTYKP